MSDIFGNIFDALQTADGSDPGWGSLDTGSYFDQATQSNQQMYAAASSDGSSLNPDGTISYLDGGSNSIASPGEGVTAGAKGIGGLVSKALNGFASSSQAYTSAQRSSNENMGALGRAEAMSQVGSDHSSQGANANKPQKADKSAGVNPLVIEQEWISRLRNFGTMMSLAKRTASTPNSAKAIISSEGDLY